MVLLLVFQGDRKWGPRQRGACGQAGPNHKKRGPTSNLSVVERLFWKARDSRLFPTWSSENGLLARLTETKR